MIPALIGAAASITNMIGQNANVRDQIQANKEENDKTRRFNLMLANTQNKWNQEQWERQNDYNSPTAQMARLRAAGLNPDLVYGGSAPAGMSGPSPEMTAGAPAVPTDLTALGQKMTLGQAMQTALSYEAQKAMIDKTKADTEKVKADTQGQNYTNEVLKSDAAFRDALNEGQVKLNNMTLEVSNTNMKLTNEQIAKLRKEIEQIDAELPNIKENLNLIRSQFSNLDADTAIKKIDQFFRAAFNRNTIKKLVSETKMSNFALHQAQQLLKPLIANTRADTLAKDYAATSSVANARLANASRAHIDAQTVHQLLENGILNVDALKADFATNAYNDGRGGSILLALFSTLKELSGSVDFFRFK